MKFLFRIITFVLIVIPISCVKEIRSEDEFIIPEPVVNALFNEGDIMNIQISLSRNIIHTDAGDEFLFLDSAVIRLYENNNELNCNLSYDNNLYTLTSLDLEPENLYRIEIQIPNYNLLIAESTIPASSTIDSIDVRRVLEIDPEFNVVSRDIIRGSVIFNDDPEKNYYMLQLEAFDYIFGNESFDSKNDYFTSTDEIAIDADYKPEDMRALVFNDNLFNGNTCNLNFEVIDGVYSEGTKDSTVLICKLYTLSEDLYQYLLTYQYQYTSDFTMMSEPINLYSNVENGLGIFAGYSLDTFLISIK